VMVHIDPEDDAHARPNAHLPQRHLLLAHLYSRLGEALPDSTRIVLHYLNGKIEAEILLDTSVDIAGLQRRCLALVADDPYYRSISLHQAIAPK